MGEGRVPYSVPSDAWTRAAARPRPIVGLVVEGARYSPAGVPDRQRCYGGAVRSPRVPISSHYVVIDGRRFLPKQVIGEVTGLDRADFTCFYSRTHSCTTMEVP